MSRKKADRKWKVRATPTSIFTKAELVWVNIERKRMGLKLFKDPKWYK